MSPPAPQVPKEVPMELETTPIEDSADVRLALFDFRIRSRSDRGLGLTHPAK
jgi:hypothetical protein